jgi:hypothetical protein
VQIVPADLRGKGSSFCRFIQSYYQRESDHFSAKICVKNQTPGQFIDQVGSKLIDIIHPP